MTLPYMLTQHTIPHVFHILCDLNGTEEAGTHGIDCDNHRGLNVTDCLGRMDRAGINYTHACRVIAVLNLSGEVLAALTHDMAASLYG
jgi:hypothetical protein